MPHPHHSPISPCSPGCQALVLGKSPMLMCAAAVSSHTPAPARGVEDTGGSIPHRKPPLLRPLSHREAVGQSPRQREQTAGGSPSNRRQGPRGGGARPRPPLPARPRVPGCGELINHSRPQGNTMGCGRRGARRGWACRGRAAGAALTPPPSGLISCTHRTRPTTRFSGVGAIGSAPITGKCHLERTRSPKCQASQLHVTGHPCAC